MKIETSRLILRDWKSNDLHDLVEGLNNLEVARWLAMVPHPYTQEHAAKWVEYCVEIAGKKGGE